MSNRSLERIIEVPLKASEATSLLNAGASLIGKLIKDHRLKELALMNATDVPVHVYLRYRTITSEGDWLWFPKEGYVHYRLAPGEAYWAWHDGIRVAASRIRIYAKAARKPTFWDIRYKHRDLWLVRNVYTSPLILTYIHPILRPGQRRPSNLSRFLRLLSP